MKASEWGKRARSALGKYKYVLLVALVGVLLLLWPGQSPAAELTETSAAPERSGEDLFQLRTLEQRLETALSQVEGAGEVSVVLTLKETPRQVVAQDGAATEGGGETRREATTVLASGGSGVQEPVKLQELAPAYQGALVVAQGGGDPQVKLALTQAVSALTGLGADQISICKGK